MEQGRGLILRVAVSRYSGCTAVDSFRKRVPVRACGPTLGRSVHLPVVAPSLGVPPSVGSAECGHEVPTGA
jgi:hypothetical protein